MPRNKLLTYARVILQLPLSASVTHKIMPLKHFSYIRIILAFMLKDNRAFCKYLCPITVFLKPGARASIVKISADPDKCNQCLACERICPMDILITEYTEINRRVTSSECIFCLKCVNACSQDAISITAGLDFGRKELLRTREDQS